MSGGRGTVGRICALAIASVLWQSLAAPSASAAPATTYQINAAHDGAQQDAALTPPFERRWVRELGAAPSYPIIANGRVFIAVPTSPYPGTRLFALDARTGDTLWSVNLAGDSTWSGLAYESGRVFAQNASGVLQALDESTGAGIWSRRLPEYPYDTPPMVSDGILYTAGNANYGTLFALRSDTGAIVWSRPVTHGTTSSPALGLGSVFVAYACFRVYAFDRVTGLPRWDNYEGCTGGGGKTAVYHDGRLYVRESGREAKVFDAATGTVVGSFSSAPAPAFSGGFGFFVTSGTVEGRSLDTSQVAWSFSDGAITTAPIVVNDTVIVGSETGRVYALERSTGRLVWSDQTGRAIPPPDEQNRSAPLTGMGAGDGLLVVPAQGGRIVAYQPSAASSSPVTLEAIPTPSSDPTPTFKGIAQASSSAVQVTVQDSAGSVVQTRIATPDAVSGSYTVDAEPPLAPGDYTAQASQPDPSGNLRVSERRSFTVQLDDHSGHVSSITVDTGQRVSGEVGSLNASDGDFLVIKGGRKRVTWTATFTGIDNSITSIDSEYGGSNSRPCEFTESVYNFASKQWVAVNRQSSSVDPHFVFDESDLPGSLSQYVSGESGRGSLMIRISCRARRVLNSSDLLEISFSSTGSS